MVPGTTSSSYPVDSYYNVNRYAFTLKSVFKPLRALKDTILYSAVYQNVIASTTKGYIYLLDLCCGKIT